MLLKPQPPAYIAVLFSAALLLLVLLLLRAQCRAARRSRLQQEAALRTQQVLRDALLNAEQANCAKSSFLSRMSHEIRTPMNAIIGMTAIAGHYLDDRARLEDCLTKIGYSSEHLMALINDVLDMSKIEVGKMTLAHLPFDLDALLDTVVATFSPQLEAGGLSFTLTRADLGKVALVGDSLRVNQILMNLLSNAIKFTPHGGAVGLTVCAEEKAEQQLHLRFIVRDTGIGMSADFLGRLFSPFEQADFSTTQKYGGTGLGMSITHNLVLLMGGTITVQSKVDEGSTFTVDLDAETVPAVSEPASHAALSSGTDSLTQLTGTHLLLAEDNALNCEILVELLKMMDITAVCAEDGVEVVDLFAASAPGTYDAILMDVQMPRMDGYQATRAIRTSAHPQACNIPILAMTANAFSEDVAAALAAGMNAHLSKPIDPAALNRMLVQALSDAKSAQKTAQDGKVFLASTP